jgi:hypothetical protein
MRMRMMGTPDLTGIEQQETPGDLTYSTLGSLRVAVEMEWRRLGVKMHKANEPLGTSSHEVWVAVRFQGQKSHCYHRQWTYS